MIFYKKYLQQKMWRKIMSIPLSKNQHADRLIWVAPHKGIFTMRSAFHMEVERKKQQGGESSKTNEKMELWKDLWKLQFLRR